MALVHKHLYDANDLSSLNLKTYVLELIELLFQSYTVEDRLVTFNCDVEDIHVLLDTAIPCGLIINELVSNSLKHAFNGKTGTGQISVQFAKANGGNLYRFSVADSWTLGWFVIPLVLLFGRRLLNRGRL